jgi:peptidoglycan-associated lipoprotein
MVKRIAIACLGILALGALLFVAGCAKTAPPPPSGPPPAETAEPAPEPPARPPKDPGRLDIENLDIYQLRRIVEERGLLADINFDFDEYALRPDARRILNRNAQFLREYPTIKIQIQGHCDERGTPEYNLALGDKRAHAAKSYLTRVGIRTGRMSTISYGEERPLDPRSNEEAWARNRRAHFLITAK